MSSIIGRYIPDPNNPDKYIDLPVAVDVNGVVQMNYVSESGLYATSLSVPEITNSILSAINQSTDIDSLISALANLYTQAVSSDALNHQDLLAFKTANREDLTALLNSVNSTNTLLNSALPFNELVWKDSTSTVYIRSKQASGAVSYYLPDGTTYVPVGASTLAATRDGSDDLEIEQDTYTAATTVNGWVENDTLVRSTYIDLTNQSIKAIVWRNLNTGEVIVPAPIVNVDAIISSENSSALKLDLILAKLGEATDQAILSTQDGTALARLRGIQKTLEDGSGVSSTSGVSSAKNHFYVYRATITTTDFLVNDLLLCCIAHKDTTGFEIIPNWWNLSQNRKLTTVPIVQTQTSTNLNGSDTVDTTIVNRLDSLIYQSNSNLSLSVVAVEDDLGNALCRYSTYSPTTQTHNQYFTDFAGNQVVNPTIVSVGTNSIGTKSSSVATSDTGNFSLIALVKRLLTKLPLLATSQGRLIVDGSEVIQPVSQSGLWNVNVGLTNVELRATPVDVTGNFYPSTQSISATSLPLPTGAATESNQTVTNTKLDLIVSNTNLLTNINNSANLLVGKIPANLTVSVANRLLVDSSGVTQPVSVVSLPLPTGAATESNQTALLTLETSIAANTLTGANILDDINTKLSGTLLVDGSATIQPVAVGTLPLPTGAATEAKQDIEVVAINSAKTTINNSIGAASTLAAFGVDELKANQVLEISNLEDIKVTANQIKLESEVIKTTLQDISLIDYATATNQNAQSTQLTTINNNLVSANTTSIADRLTHTTKLTEINQSIVSQNTLSTNSNALLTSIKDKDFATETSLSAIKDAILNNVNISESIWTDDSGTFFIREVVQDADTGAATITFKLFDGTPYIAPSVNPHPADKTLNIVQPLTDTELRATPIQVTGAFFQSTQPVNVVNPIFGFATADNQDITNVKLTGIKTTLDDTATVLNNIYLDTQTLDTINTNTADTVISTNITNTKLTTTNDSLVTLSNKVPAGITTNNNRLIVDGSSVVQPVSQSGTWNVNIGLTDTELRATPIDTYITNTVPVSGTFYPANQPVSVVSLPLPTGAATEFKQTEGNDLLTSIGTKLNTLDTTSLLDISSSNTSIVTSTNNINLKLPADLTVVDYKLQVDGSKVVQPVSQSGIWNVNTGTTQGLTDEQLRAAPINVLFTDTVPISQDSILFAKYTVCGVYIIAGGTNYIDGTAVTFTGGTGTAATGTLVVIEGTVVGVKIILKGDYSIAPTGLTTTGSGVGLTTSLQIGSAVEIELLGNSALRGYISSGNTYPVYFEASTNGYTWFSIDVIGVNAPSGNQTATYPYTFNANVSGATHFRVRRAVIDNSLTNTVYISISKGDFSASRDEGLTNTQLRATEVAVTGTFFPTIQPVSAINLPLPNGAATDLNLSQIASTANTNATSLQATTTLIQAYALKSAPPQTPIQRFLCFETIDQEKGFALVNCKKIDIKNQMHLEYRFGYSTGVCGTPNCHILEESEFKWSSESLGDYTGNFVLSASEIPDPVTITGCTTISGNTVVTGIFNNVYAGQRIVGVGIPDNSYVVVNNTRTEIKLFDETGYPVVANFSGTTSLEFKGAVLRFTLWN